MPLTKNQKDKLADFVKATMIEYFRKPTDSEIADACMSYRHDFGLLSEEEQKKTIQEAKY